MEEEATDFKLLLSAAQPVAIGRSSWRGLPMIWLQRLGWEVGKGRDDLIREIGQ